MTCSENRIYFLDVKLHLVQAGDEIRRLVSKIPVRRTRKRCQKILHSVQNDT